MKKESRKLLSLVFSLVLTLSMCIALAVPGFSKTDATSSATQKTASEEVNVKDFINEISKKAASPLFAGGNGTKANLQRSSVKPTGALHWNTENNAG